MRPSVMRFLALAALLGLNGLAHAAPVTDQLDAARKAYDAGELRTAVDTLNFAVAAIREQETARLLKLLPEPLEGWQGEPGKSVVQRYVESMDLESIQKAFGG